MSPDQFPEIFMLHVKGLQIRVFIMLKQLYVDMKFTVKFRKLPL